MTTEASLTPKNVPVGLALREAAIAGAVAALINAIIYYAVRFFVIQGPLLVETPQGDILGIVPVLIASILPALIAGLIYWALDRFLANPNPAFLGVSAVVFIVMIFGPLNATNDPAAGWTLEIMHGVVAVPVIMAMLSLKGKL